MELSTIKTLLAEPTKLIEKIKATRPDAYLDYEKAKDIEPENHAVMDLSQRKRREVKYDTGLKDDEGNDIMRTEYEERIRIPSAIEKQIVSWAVQMAASEPVEMFAKPANDTEQLLVDVLDLTLRDNKVEFLYQEFLRLTATYTCCAQIWYEDDAEPGFWEQIGLTGKKKMTLMLLSAETGDTLYPIVNGMRKMIGLGREYIIKDDNDKDVPMFDAFFSDYILTYKQESGTGWVLANRFKIPYGKANFIFDSQPRNEWADITPKRVRKEDVDSDLGEQNLATGSPIIVASKLVGLGKRGETGKVFETEDGGKVEILEAAGAPESVKMELDNLTKGLYYDTSTPDMSIFDAEGMGANTPGITIKMRLLPATMKAKRRHQGSFGMSVQRQYNLLKSALCYLHPSLTPAKGMSISPRFKTFLPSNETEDYANIVSLVGAGLMSKDTAVRKLAFTDSPEEEYAKIMTEAKEAAALIPAPISY